MHSSLRRRLDATRLSLIAALLLAVNATSSVHALTGTFVVHGPTGGGNTYPNPPFPGCNGPVTNGGWLTSDTPSFPAPLLSTFVVGPVGAPAGPPMGTGSLLEATGGAPGAAKALLFTSFGGAPLGLIASILNPATTGYGSYAGSATGGENVFILFVSYDGGVTIGDQVQFVPALNGCFIPGGWATCNPLGGMFKTSVAGPGNPHDPTASGGFFTLAAYIGFAANAAATVPSSAASNPTLAIVTSGGPGVSANLDKFRFASSGPPLSGPFDVLEWDFEADCTNYGGDADMDCFCNVANPLVVNHDTCPTVSNALCTAAATPTACCTGAGTGTCNSQTDTDLDGVGDVCDNCPALGNGACTGHGTPSLCCTGLGTGTCGDQTDANSNGMGDVCDSLCPAAPAVCLAAGKSTLQIKDDTMVTSNKKLGWRWSKGTLAAVQADFGDPVLGTSRYSVCVYDETAGVPSLKMSAGVAPGGTCSGKPCWSSTAQNKGWSYSDKTGTASGITKIRFASGVAGKPSLQVSGKGGSLPLPAAFSATEYFDQDTTVTVQLHNGVAGNCWSSSFAVAGTKKNVVNQFKAGAP